MNAERWPSVKRLLQSALERPREEREPFLRRECAGDDALRSEVESLLAAHDQAGSFLASGPDPGLKPGMMLGSYEIISLIGAGGMGEVYRARDSRIGREVAIKRLPQSLGEDPDRLRRFEREARLAGSLNHPNLVTIHDVGSHDVPFVVMELLRGETLRGELSRRPDGFPLRKALEYAIEIASGLAAAHEQGIVHRDLKPENIFVTDDGRLKILDFGLAKTVRAEPVADAATLRRESDAATAKGVVLGTAPYMSPEQVTGEPVGVRSDIFSFGLILYEMLSGRRPFKRDSTIETMHAIVTVDAPQLFRVRPSVPVYLERIVRRCIEKKPAARFQSARDVAYALEALETSTGESVASATPQRKRPVLWVVIAAAVVISAAAGTWVAVTQRSRPISYERLTFRRGIVTQARFAPDGRTVIFSAAWDGEPSRIFVKRPEGNEIVPLDLPPAVLLSVSRAGELAILLEPRLPLPFEPIIGTLARVSMNGGSPRRLVENVLSADWSPDGSSIALVRDTGRDQRLEIRSADGSELVRQLFATSSGSLGHVRFSPSGNRIACIARSARLGQGARAAPVLVMNADGTDQRSVGSAALYTDLSWSADGHEVWFAEGDHIQTTIRAASMSGGMRTLSRSTSHTWFSESQAPKFS